jgi:hypothetical protein
MEVSKFKKALLKNGGATISVKTGNINPKSGYFVSLADRGGKFPIEKFKEMTFLILISYISENRYFLLDESEDYFLGGWVYEDTVYLDVSVRIEDREEAIEIGLLNNQLAIYDANNQECILLNEIGL